MQNVMIGFPNLADKVSLSGGAWSATMPRDAMLTRELDDYSRSADLALASTQFAVALDAPRPVRILAWCKDNLSTFAKYRVTAANVEDFSALVYDSGWLDRWTSVYTDEVLMWEDVNFWWGKMPEEDRAAYPANLIHVFPATSTALHYRLEVDDALNPDGYVQGARLFLSPAWSPRNNYSYGAGLGYEPNTRVSRTPGGVEYFDPQPGRRTFEFRLDWLSQDEALAKALDMQIRAGRDGEVLVIPDADDAIHAVRRNFLGRLDKFDPITHPAYATHKAGFLVKERT